MKTIPVFFGLTFMLSCAFLVGCETQTPGLTSDSSGLSDATYEAVVSTAVVDAATATETESEALQSHSESENATTTPPEPTTSGSETTTHTPRPTTKNSTVTTSETTTHPKPTVMPIPPTAPSPTVHTWSFNNGDEVCILMKMAAQIGVMYNNTARKVVESYLNIPKDAKVSNESSCSSHRQVLKLDFEKNSVSFTFSQNSSKTYVSEIVVTYFADSKNFPGAPFINKDVTVKSNSSDFVTSKKKSLVCRSAQTFSLNQDTTIMIKDVQVEAFRTKSSKTFSESEPCPLDKVKTPVIVPIVVGCILGGLLVVVIIAFIIGKRRFSSNRPYEDL